MKTLGNGIVIMDLDEFLDVLEGKGTPETLAALESDKVHLEKPAIEGSCLNCKQPFSTANTHSEAGWRETRISGFCEDCFDRITKEPS